MAPRHPDTHPWAKRQRNRKVDQKFIDAPVKNPDGITATICPPGNAMGCVLGLDGLKQARTGISLEGKNVGRIHEQSDT